MTPRGAAGILLLTMTTVGCVAQQPSAHRFTIYEFIPYHEHMAANGPTALPPLDRYLETLGIHKIDVVYEKRYMTNGQPDKEKIEAVAQQALASHEPVSFDTEFGKRYQPETVIPGVSEILSIYHEANHTEPAGVYATAPQNTYAWKPDIANFDALNKRYAPIAQQVDFLSPVLYNYEGTDNAAWERAAEYNMAAAKKYETGKPVLPYINPVIRLESSGKDDKSQRGPVRMLTEAEMLFRLQTLYKLGADGCIVWASSKDRLLDGTMPVFDRNSGWGKALADFAAAHP